MPLKTVNAYWWDLRVPCLVLKKETMSMEDPACIVHQVPEELRMRKDEVQCQWKKPPKGYATASQVWRVDLRS